VGLRCFVLIYDPVGQAIASILETSNCRRALIPLHYCGNSTEISSEAAIQTLHCVLRNWLNPVVAGAIANGADGWIISVVSIYA
jgi:hypothetical protein